MRWFKHDTNALSDLKLRLVLKRFGMAGIGVYWGMIEMLAGQSDLYIRLTQAPVDLLADNFRMNAEDLQEMLDAFAELDLIDKEQLSHGVVYCPTLTKRVDEYSQKSVRRIRKSVVQDGVQTVSGACPDIVGVDIELEQDGEQRKNIPPPSPSGGGEVEELVSAWNQAAAGRFCQVGAITQERREKLRARLKDAYFKANWREAINRLQASSFVSGAGSNGWKANLDWFIRNNNTIVCILEGKYDDQKYDKYIKPARR